MPYSDGHSNLASLPRLQKNSPSIPFSTLYHPTLRTASVWQFWTSSRVLHRGPGARRGAPSSLYKPVCSVPQNGKVSEVVCGARDLKIYGDIYIYIYIYMLLFKAQFTHALPCHGVIYSFQCNNILQALCSKLDSCPKNSHSSLSRLLIFPPSPSFLFFFSDYQLQVQGRCRRRGKDCKAQAWFCKSKCRTPLIPIRGLRRNCRCCNLDMPCWCHKRCWCAHIYFFFPMTSLLTFILLTMYVYFCFSRRMAR